MKKVLVISSILLLLAAHIHAQYTTGKVPEPTITFRHLTRAHGLASNIVHSILQDKRGFMWLGTDKGLNRYDGRTFVLFTHNEKDTNSLSDNNITALYEDRSGRIWIGTQNNGVTVYDPATDQYKRYLHDESKPGSINKGYVAQIYQDSHGRYWVCLYGGGLELLDEKTDTFIHHLWKEDDSTSIAGNKVKAIYELSPGKYLVGTFEAGGDLYHDLRNYGHINYYDLSTNKFKPVHVGEVLINNDYRDDVFMLERLVHTIVPGSTGHIWFGTYCGILRYDPATGQWVAFRHNDKDITTLSKNIVRSICELNGKLYFGTEGGGINILDTATGKFTHYKNDLQNPNSLSDDFVKVVYRDKEDRIWIATQGGGINIIDPVNKEFTVYPYNHLKILPDTRQEDVTIHTICPAGKGTVLIGSGTGLTILNTITNDVTLIQKKHEIESRQQISATYAISPSIAGHYWVGIHNGIYKFYPKTQKLSLYNKKVARNLFLVAIVETPDSGLVVNLFGKFTYKLLPDQTFDSVSVRIKSLIVKGKSGQMWARYHLNDAADELVGIDKNGRITFYNYVRKDTQEVRTIFSLYVDHRDRLWISGNKGLHRLDKNTGKFIQYKNISNLPDTIINGMTEDGDGNMWFLTNDALLRMDTTGTVTTYEAYKDMPVHKPESRIVYDDAEDAIYFAANEGLVKFHPRQLTRRKVMPHVYITEFRLFNKVIQTDSSALIKRVYHLPYNQNFITFNFTSLSYAGNAVYNHAYKLEGLNEDWVEVSNKHEANFTNLSPGTYHFKVRVSSRDGKYTSESDAITVIIASPWWRTTWFYILLIVAVVLLLIGYNRYRTRRFRKKTVELETTVAIRTAQYKKEKENAENSERLRREFLANMSHEIRTPINAIAGFTELLLARNPDRQQIEYLSAINKSSDLLRHIVNDILDLSKIEAGKLNIESISFSVTDIIDRLLDILSFFATEKKLALQPEINANVPASLIGDPYRISQVLLNLCSNAIKFTERGGVYVNVNVLSANGDKVNVCFTVRDTGIGIPNEKLSTLFKDFAQVNPSDTRTHGGTGLGLSISKKLVELMGGELTAVSKMGEGSVFTFVLPLQNDTTVQQIAAHPEGVIDGRLLNGLNILVADDNEYNRRVVCDTLHLKAEVHIDTAVTGEEAIALVAEKHYDVVLMDVQMPAMSGIDATRYIRKNLPEQKRHVPIIALTAVTRQSETELCWQAGMNAVITKPFHTQNLLANIARVTRRYKGETAVNHTAIPMQGADPNTNNIHTVTDLTYLRSFCEGDEERVSQYIHLYIQSVPLFYTKATAMVSENDNEGLAEIIHSFKPKWKMMGMHYACKLALKVEDIYHTGTTDKLAFVEELLSETRQSVLELKQSI